MQIKEIKSQEELDNFVAAQKLAQFLQSWQWGEFQQEQGRTIWRLGVYEDVDLTASALVIKQTLPIGKSYLYCPRGPVISSQATPVLYQQRWQVLLRAIQRIGRKQGSIFIKIEPPIELDKRHDFFTATQNFDLRSVPFVQPQDTWMIDLAQNHDQLLQNMHAKTRYNIRLAERKGVRVRLAQSGQDFEAFWQLTKQTTARDDFSAHARTYYQAMLSALSSEFVRLYIAEYQGQIIAANIIVWFGQTATYLHGASADKYRNVMAPYALQWQQLQDAKEQGLRYYDFWGIAPPGSAKEKAWAGITRFKQYFGGFEVRYIGTHDLILHGRWYRLYKLAHQLWK